VRSTVPTDPTALTVGDVIDRYITQHVRAPGRRVSGQKTMEWHLNTLRRTLIPAAHGTHIRFEQKPIKDVVKADIDAIRTARRAHTAAAGRSGGETGHNRLLERCRALFNWSIGEGYLDHSPFTRGGVAVVKLTKETPRSRRLVDAGDEARLLACAGPHLRDVIIAALSTACRLGELPSLQWQDIRTTTTATGKVRQTLVLHAAKTKTATRREVPVGQRLAGVLAMRTHAPDGQPFGPDAYVFGNAVGEQISSIKKAWMTCVLKAHGHTPQWVKGTRNHLSPESRAAYRAINLHFHDLRRECASRLAEAGVPLPEIRDILGHTTTTQTSTYLGSTPASLVGAIERMEKHQQQVADAEQRAEAQASAPPVGAPVLAAGSDRIQ
jgi:integrase